MQPQFADLHTHSTASDGTDTPTELVKKAAALKIKALALTDHDTISGLAEAEAAGEKYGVEIIRGCELGVSSPYGEVHLLGLWLPADTTPLAAALTDLQNKRGERNEKIIIRLNELGIPITYAQVQAIAQGESIGRPHIAQCLLREGYVQSIADAFQMYLAAHAQAYIPRAIPSLHEGLKLLQSLNCLISWAHPLLLDCPLAWYEEIIPTLKPLGLQALEAYYSAYSAKDERYCVGLAARHGLLLTGGSDYHGSNKPLIYLGRGRGGLRFTTGMLDLLKSRKQ